MEGLSHPECGVEFLTLVAHFKVEYGAVVVGGVGVDGPEHLTGVYFLPLSHVAVGQTGIDGEIFAVAQHHDGVESVLTEDGRDGAVKHCARRGARGYFDVDARVVGDHMFLRGVGLAAKLTHYLVTTAYGEEQLALVG